MEIGARLLVAFEGASTYVLVFGVLTLLVMIFVWMLQCASNANPCFFVHQKKRYVAIRNLAWCRHIVGWAKNGSHQQDARWICDECGSVGEECIDVMGLWKIEHGKLVLDEKRWTAWQDEVNGK